LKVIADLNVPEALIWVDSEEVKLGDDALLRQSFFHQCNTTGPDGRTTGPDFNVYHPDSAQLLMATRSEPVFPILGYFGLNRKE
jgi:hypothetical protein